MVSIQHPLPPPSGQDSATIHQWLEALGGIYPPPELALIRQACEFAAPLYQGKVEMTGMPLLQHALGAASILAGLSLDHETCVAAILHAVPSYLEDFAASLGEHFGPNITRLVTGISRVEHISQFSEMRPGQNQEDAARQIESLRMMLLAMVEDIRVVLIKLAERTQTLRNLAQMPEEVQVRVARETRAIFAPLANRLGVWQLKWELEDLSLRFLEPTLYKQVAKMLDERRVDRERYIADVIEQLSQAMQQAHIPAEVTGRPKHIHSIVAKMKRKGLEFGELYDVRAVRILVNSIHDCYAALSTVHNLWASIPSEFDDYIANPKPNGYRSLHTAVIGPRDLTVEVQIRTRDMHHDSELGVAAHWRYKENKKSEAQFDEKISWLRQILAWKAELADSGNLQEQFRTELLVDRVYVLTPQGKVIDLPKGATPVDFAYALHTDLGHRTRGAKVDGNIVPLKYQLQNGQRIEILTAKQGGPSRDWLSTAYLKSARARAKVRHWFKSQNIEESIAQGRILLDRELQRLGVPAANLDKLAQRLRFNKPDDLCAALGHGDLSLHRLAIGIQQEYPAKVAAATPAIARPATRRASENGVLIEGVDNLMIRMAKCCQPEKPAPIVGYITRDRGITIHRQNCSFLLRIPEENRDRLLNAEWT